MFREVSRKKQALSQQECIRLLQDERRGVLSVVTPEGYPYCMPINHYYHTDGHLYFHGGMKGHRVDALAENDKVCFCVYDRGFRREGEWALNIKSVIVFGRMRIVHDPVKALEVIRALSYHFTDDADYIEAEIRKDAGHTLCMELIPEHITGKITNEA